MVSYLENKSIKFKILFLCAVILIPVIIMTQFIILPNLKERIYQGKQETTKYAVDLAMGIISHNYQLFLDKKISEEEAKKNSLEQIKVARYNSSEYFWINDMGPKMIMHPIKEKLIGQDLSQMKDPNGKFLFMEMVDVVKKSKAGYVNYMWPKPNEEKPIPKISYVSGFEPWSWVVGTGIYVDDVEKEVGVLSKKIWSIMGAIVILAFILTVIFSNRISNKLETITNQIHDEAKSFSQSSKTLNHSSHELSSRTNDSAAALQETSASLEEISSMLKKSYDNMNFLKEKAKTSVENVDQGKKSLDQMLDALKLVNTNNDQMNEQMKINNQEMHKIISLISEISEKTKVINDIVFQTKLLSFNASVEAARAGEHGKGFAVVAEEVGSLAKMSGDASREIWEILNRSTKMVAEIVENGNSKMAPILETSNRYINGSEEKARACSVYFDKIVDETSEINNMIDETSEALKEQNIAVSEITKAISDLDLLTQKNAQSAKENVSSADVLEHEAQELHLISEKLDSLINGRKAS